MHPFRAAASKIKGKFRFLVWWGYSLFDTYGKQMLTWLCTTLEASSLLCHQADSQAHRLDSLTTTPTLWDSQHCCGAVTGTGYHSMGDTSQELTAHCPGGRSLNKTETTETSRVTASDHSHWKHSFLDILLELENRKRHWKVSLKLGSWTKSSAELFLQAYRRSDSFPDVSILNPNWKVHHSPSAILRVTTKPGNYVTFLPHCYTEVSLSIPGQHYYKNDPFLYLFNLLLQLFSLVYT